MVLGLYESSPLKLGNDEFDKVADSPGRGRVLAQDNAAVAAAGLVHLLETVGAFLWCADDVKLAICDELATSSRT